MLEQFIKSILAYFVKIEPMNAYVQAIPEGVEYPCYFVNKCDISTETLNSYYFLNNVNLYIRIFGENEVELKNKSFNLVQHIFNNQRRIPILEEDGSESGRLIRLENIETIEIPVDENEMYCTELNFSFDTSHHISPGEFEILGKVYLNHKVRIPNLK